MALYPRFFVALGGGDEVGASSYLLQVDGKRVLVDAGLRLGGGRAYPDFPFLSQVGMLAGTIVYVNAGKELAKIDSLSGILSPGVIISFVILGLFPITVKKFMGWYRAKRGISREVSGNEKTVV